MTGPARKGSLRTPKHGTEARYRSRQKRWEPCRCEPCRTAYIRACKRRELDRVAGRKLIYPSSLVVAHVAMLNEAGMNVQTIARRAGVTHSTIWYMLRGRTKTCLRDTALAILGVRLGDFDESSDRPVAGVRRRVRALYAVGHGPRTIAQAAGMCSQAISSIANGRTRWADHPTETAVYAAYALLRDQPGTSDAARRRAKQQGWRDPLWWDDMEAIDDPLFDEEAAERELNRELSRNELGALRRAEVEHLMSFGLDADAISTRLEMATTTVQTIINETRSGVRRQRSGVAA